MRRICPLPMVVKTLCHSSSLRKRCVLNPRWKVWSFNNNINKSSYNNNKVGEWEKERV